MHPGLANVRGVFVKEPRGILESVAVQIAEHGIDFEAVAGRSYGALTASDFALAVAIAGDELGQAAFFARWLDDRGAQRKLSTLLLPFSVPIDRFRLQLAGAATFSYVHNGVSVRSICQALRISQTNTWPKLEKPYFTMLGACYTAERNFARQLRKILL